MELSTANFWIAFFLALQVYYPEELDPLLKPYDTPQNQMEESYDFIIVGAGSAGCVLANRLTENPYWTVLLIEAGGDETPISDTPLFTFLLLGSQLDWNFTTVRQKRACLASNGRCDYSQGRVMGGSSAINNMDYVRGNRQDYDAWAQAHHGNQGWGYKDVLPYFIKAENNTEPSLASSKYRGTKGPLNVQYSRWRTLLSEEYMRARQDLASNGRCEYPQGRVMGGSSAINNMDYVRGNRQDYDAWAHHGNQGWGYKDVLPYFIKAENNTEPSLASSKYRGTKGPLNVQYSRWRTLLSEEKIKAGQELRWQKQDINGENQTGIAYSQLTMNGASRGSASRAYLNPIRKRRNLTVIKRSFVEKILLAEFYNIAIGVSYRRNGEIYIVKARKEVIISAGAINTPKLLMLSGIGPQEELRRLGIEVILNLPVGKHLQDHPAIFLNFQINQNLTLTTDVWKTNEAIIKYARDRKGPLTSNGENAVAFLNPFDAAAPPSIMYNFLNFVPQYEEPQRRQIISIAVVLVHPTSVGSVKLNSTKPQEQPLINPNYLSEEIEFKTMYKGLEIVFDYMNTPTMQKYSPKLYTEDQPICNKLPRNIFIKCVIEQYTISYNHPVGTVKMGPANDPLAVVSPELMVKGFKNLRVIGSSVMPYIPRGSTNAPTIMIAEKAADIVKRRHGSY